MRFSFIAKFLGLLLDQHFIRRAIAALSLPDLPLTEKMMYAATLEPLLQQCNEAIEMAKQGAIDDARICLDRIRFLRSLLAQNKGNAEPAHAEQANVVAQSPLLLQRYIEVATSVNQRLETLHQWITQSRASFSIEELRQSYAGMNLFVDDALPGIWDFKQDIVLLTDPDGEVIRDVLRARGQAKFIWMTRKCSRCQ